MASIAAADDDGTYRRRGKKAERAESVSKWEKVSQSTSFDRLQSQTICTITSPRRVLVKSVRFKFPN
jgi:hypothetical protein